MLIAAKSPLFHHGRSSFLSGSSHTFRTGTSKHYSSIAKQSSLLSSLKNARVSKPQNKKLVRFFSSNGETKQNTRRSFFTFKRLAFTIRIIRIPALIVSVYGLGYQQGVMDCTRNPQGLQEQLFKSILAGVGVKDWSQVKILSEEDISYTSFNKHHQVASVGDRIIHAAREHVTDELDKAMMKVQQRLPEDISPEDAMEYIRADDSVEFWYSATQRILGEVNSANVLVDLLAADGKSQPSSNKKLKRVPWQYVFIDSKAPNAFVTEILPHRVFITSAMLDLATTQDELAMVLGHEISHLILGHVSQTNQVETMLRTLEVLLLSIDPTEGLISLVIIGGLAAIRKAIAASNSRENEQEADALGIQITARGCFNTVAGTKIMKKMHDAKESMSPTPKPVEKQDTDATQTAPAPPTMPTTTQMYDTHPPTMERYERLYKAASEGENYTKYLDGKCATISSRIAAALGWGPQ